MVLGPTADRLDAGYGAVLVNRVLLFGLLIGLLLEYLLNGCALLTEFLVQVCFENTVVERLKHAIDMISNVKLSIWVDEILAEWLEKLRRFIVRCFFIENLNLL